jgi:hypothetical protein
MQKIITGAKALSDISLVNDKLFFGWRVNLFVIVNYQDF